MFSEAADPELAASAWRNVCVQDWTASSGLTFLETLTPRQLVYQMRMWSILAEVAPGLSQEFNEAVGQARDILRKARMQPAKD